MLRPVPYESEPVDPPRPLSSLRLEEERESPPKPPPVRWLSPREESLPPLP